MLFEDIYIIRFIFHFPFSNFSFLLENNREKFVSRQKLHHFHLNAGVACGTRGFARTCIRIMLSLKSFFLLGDKSHQPSYTESVERWQMDFYHPRISVFSMSLQFHENLWSRGVSSDGEIDEHNKHACKLQVCNNCIMNFCACCTNWFSTLFSHPLFSQLKLTSAHAIMKNCKLNFLAAVAYGIFLAISHAGLFICQRWILWAIVTLKIQ